MNPDDVIENIAESEAMAEADVREIYEAKLAECEDADLKGDAAEERAVKMLWGTFKRRQQSNAVKVEGMFLASGDRYDAVEYGRDQSIEAYQENPQKAIKDGEIAVACPPEESGNLTGAGVQVVGQKNGWDIVANPENEQILQYNFAERRPGSGEVEGTDDGDPSVEDGWRLYPLDTRKTFSSGDENQNYGMPTDKHQWTRRGIGIFRSEATDGDVRVGNITLRGKASVAEPSLFEGVKFKARVDEDDDNGELYLNSTSDTEIEENPELDDNLPQPDELIQKYFSGTEYLHDMQSVYEYMAEQDGRRTVIVEADVYSMDLEPTSNDTLRLVVGEMNFSGGNMVDREATVWLPAWQDKYIDFAVDSRVYVIGRAQLRDAYDPETGGTTSDEQEVVINGQGIYADPAVKIPREDSVEDVDEDDFDFEADDEDDSSDDPDFEDGDW